ncbi:MAG TPA: GNAT family N-acetyltransferase [Caldimonas sp.]|jgi:GNAT superfamily N-acetyltransferase|nr:GNAT family N-acetyltransferase [Caldimonas sp.]HEX2543038.1 GNAT family N-acetyltransferase [Caldimonas sp.]
MKSMQPTYRAATPEDVPECIELRGRTRENAIPADRLAAMGITEASWSGDVRSGLLPGYVCTQGEAIVGYCFGDTGSGEVVVLALLPEHEGRGIGKHLLGLVVEHLARSGHARLYLGCSADPRTRSHGFYRHLGWQSTGSIDANGDEVLELVSAPQERPRPTPRSPESG